MRFLRHDPGQRGLREGRPWVIGVALGTVAIVVIVTAIVVVLVLR